MTILNNSLKVLYIHGRGSSNRTEKVLHLAEHFETYCVNMDTSNVADMSIFEKAVAQQEQAINEFSPDVVVGHSFGGAVAVALLQRGIWRGPTVLLAQAFYMYKVHDKNDTFWLPLEKSLPEGVPILIVHSATDDVVSIEGSRLLAQCSNPDLVKLVEVEGDHRLHSLFDDLRLVQMIKQVHSLSQSKE